MDVWQRWKQTTVANKALVLSGAIVALGTLISTSALIVQVCITQENNRKTSEQVGKLIEAANTQAGASLRNATAAESFSTSAGTLATAAKDAAQAMTAQAQAAADSLHTMRAQFQEERRPQVIVENQQMTDFQTNILSGPVKGKALAINVFLRNVGKTPAFNMITHRHLAIGSSEVEHMRVEPMESTKSGETLEQGSAETTTIVSVPDTYTNESAIITSDLRLWDGTWPIVIFGRITYEDQNGTLYCTPFVRQLLGEGVNGAWLKINQFSVGTTVKRMAKELCPRGKP